MCCLEMSPFTRHLLGLSLPRLSLSCRRWDLHPPSLLSFSHFFSSFLRNTHTHNTASSSSSMGSPQTARPPARQGLRRFPSFSDDHLFPRIDFITHPYPTTTRTTHPNPTITRTPPSSDSELHRQVHLRLHRLLRSTTYHLRLTSFSPVRLSTRTLQPYEFRTL
jgi:hypothetical protein